MKCTLPSVLGEHHTHSGWVKGGVEGSTSVNDTTGVCSGVDVRQRGWAIHAMVLRAAVTVLVEAAVEAEDDVPDYAVYGDQHRPGHCSSFGRSSLVVGAIHVPGGLGWVHCFVVQARLRITVFVGATHWAADPRLELRCPSR